MLKVCMAKEAQGTCYIFYSYFYFFIFIPIYYSLFLGYGLNLCFYKQVASETQSYKQADSVSPSKALRFHQRGHHLHLGSEKHCLCNLCRL